MRRLWLITSIAVICLCAEPVQAEKFNHICTSVPRHLWLSLQALETKVEARGYKIQKSRLTSTCAAFEVFKEDEHIELFIDPTDGEIKGSSRTR